MTMVERGMKTTAHAATSMSDVALIQEVKAAAGRERAATAQLIALLAEFDARRLYLGEGCSSLFTYCTQVLHLSEHAAYGRIEAARVARRLPRVLESLSDGEVTLTTVALLAPHLTADNHEALLTEARYKTKREVEVIVARLRPRPAVPDTIRKLPAPRSSPGRTPGSRQALAGTSDGLLDTVPVRAVHPTVVTPLSVESYKVQLTMSRDTHARLRRVQELLRHSIPSGDLASIIDRALTLLLADLERGKCAAAVTPRKTKAPSAGSRHIPSAVRRQVWARDDGRCAFIAPAGRCTERHFIEFHHVSPYAVGGEPTVDNIELRCRAHNVHEAAKYFGNRLPLLVREVRQWWTSDSTSSGARPGDPRRPVFPGREAGGPSQSRRVVV